MNRDSDSNETHAPIERGQQLGARGQQSSRAQNDLRRDLRRVRRKHSRRVLLVLTLIVAALLAIIGFGWYYFYTGPEGGPVTVNIPSGSSLPIVAQILAQKRVVRRARAFELRAQSDGYSAEIKSGTYVLHVNEPYSRLIATLVAGPKPNTVKVTIPEGFTIAQIAALVSEKLPRFSAARYLDLAQKNSTPVAVPGYKPGHTLEGLLFPATYDLEPDTTPRQLIDKQLAAFETALTNVNLKRAKKANLTPYDVAIIASLVEREAQVGAERPLVAAVIWNRLRQGMMLQIDATVQYALGVHKAVLTYDDLKVDSPYNTYLHFGLPPTPIATPGLAALQAAADPAAVDYLYYVARGDGTGRHYFSSTYSQFLADKAKAQATAN